MKMNARHLLAPLALVFSLILTETVHAQVISLTSRTQIYEQDFNTLTSSSGGSSPVPTGWWVAETGKFGNSLYSTGDGSSATGDTYSFGSGISPERALGGLSSNTVIPTFGAQFVNNSGSSSNTFSYSLVMEQWRGGGRSGNDSLLFSYRVNSGAWVSLTSNALVSKIVNASASAAALNGNLPDNQGFYNFTVTGLTWGVGDTLTIRWVDKIVSPNDGLSIENFSFMIDPDLPLLVGGNISSPWDITSPQKIKLAGAVTITGTSPKVVIVRDGATLEMLLNGVSGCDSAYIYGTVITAQNGLNLAFSSGAAKIVLGPNSTIVYNREGNQQITLRQDYANLTITGSGTKSFVAGTYEISGDFTVTTTPTLVTGTLFRFDGGNQNISCPSFNVDDIEFTNTGTKTLQSPTSVTGTLTMAGSATLASNGNLTLISNASGTARVATIPSTASITGNVTVQRYVPAVTRRWRMFSPSVTNFTFAGIKDDIFVTGTGGTTNGFDASTLNESSVCTYQESGSRGWKSITNINNTLAAGRGAIVYIRGDRTLPAPQWYTYPFVAQNEVTLDIAGPLNQGNISPSLTYTNTGSAADDGWNLVGNPYPSQINWNLVTKSNLASFYYVYDPSTGSYVSKSGNSYIASNQSFFVQAIAASPSITFRESNKSANASTNYFKTSNLPLEIRMIKDSLNSDVAWLDFNNSAQKEYSPMEDAIKMPNTTVNLGFYIDSITLLQHNATPFIQATDTFVLSAMAANGTYTLEFDHVSYTMQMYLRDLYTNSVIDLQTTSSYTFTINSDPASKGNRFQIIYADPSRLPVSWLSFSGDRLNEDVLLSWSTASEKNNRGFSIEKAEQESSTWSVIGFINGKGNSNTVNTYSFIDGGAFAQSEVVYYRIKQTDNNGTASYSQIITLRSSKAIEDATAATVYPNPVKSDLYADFTTGLTDAILEITDNYGKTILVQKNINGLNQHVDVSVLPAGVYMLKVSQSGIATQVFKFVKQ
jgi:trimeric autotransporter adhesin